MNKLPDPGEILKETHDWDYFGESQSEILEAVKEYGRRVRDRTLEWADENASIFNFEIDRDSILSGKTHKDLEI